jgi:hypothetical protein
MGSFWCLVPSPNPRQPTQCRHFDAATGHHGPQSGNTDGHRRAVGLSSEGWQEEISDTLSSVAILLRQHV